MENLKKIEDRAPHRSDTNNQPPQKAPWSPALIATITILLSVLPGGIFHALNYERLGLSQKKVSTLVTNILLFLFIFMASFIVKSILFFGLFQLIFHIGCATHFYRSQIDHYRKHLSRSGQKASVFFPIVTSIIIYLIILGVMFSISYFLDI